ncbi:MAG: NUDIX domain-containing protein [Candidatus Binatia bacterium]
MANIAPVTPIPSATVILLRDTENSLETLLLQRNAKIAFHGGAWVFPGGRIDPEDHPAGKENLFAAARQAAVREAQEEAGLTIAVEELTWLSHWTTPEGRPERYSTWFFIAASRRHDTVQIDGNEIHDHRWMKPQEALAAQRTGEIELPPPMFVTLTKLSAYQVTGDALSVFSAREPEIFVPRYKRVPEGVCSLYQDDVGYPDIDLDRPGRRHRLWMINGGWRYENSL